MVDYIPQIIPAATGLLGAIIGWAGSFYTQIYISNRTKAEERKNLAGALAAEIEAYLSLVERRGIVANAKHISSINRAGQKVLPTKMLSTYEKANSPFPIMHQNFGKIGTLGEVCTDMTRFYAQVMGVRTTITMVDEGAFNNLSAIDIADLIDSEMSFWVNTEKLGRNIIMQLRKKSD